MMLYDWIAQACIYVLAGSFAGLMSGLLGIGGGIVVVPALFFIFTHQGVIPASLCMHFAAGTSLSIMIFTSHAAIRAHLSHQDILWQVFKRLWIGIAIGVITGAVVAYFMSVFWLKLIFGLFLLFIAYKMSIGFKVKETREFPRPWIHFLVSWVIGFKSGLLGVGGGVLIVPYLTYCGVPIRKIAAVSALCTLTVSVLGTLIFMITGHFAGHSIAYTTGFIYWPAVLWVAIPSMLMAPIGARLNYVLPVKQLRYGLVVILLLTAIDLLT